MKNVTVLMEDGAFALFFRPHPGDLQKKCQCLGVTQGGRGVLGAGGID